MSSRLGALLSALHGSFDKRARAQTLKDLSAQIVDLVKELYPGVEVTAFTRPEGSAWWQPVVSGTAPGAQHVSPCSPDDEQGACVVQETPEESMVEQVLADMTRWRMVCLRKSGVSADQLPDGAALRLVGYVVATAFQDYLARKRAKALVFSLNQRVLQLNSLIDTGIEVTRLSQQESSIRLALERAAALSNASGGRATIVRGNTVVGEFSFPEGVSPTTVTPEQHRLVTQFTFAGDTYCFELFNKESRDGAVPFESMDRLLLDALARQVHAALENRDLHRQALEKQRMEQDLAVAASIQEKILPTTLPEVPGYDIAGINIPSKSVGGDYYDCIPLVDGRYALVMADVAGKGIPAALLVSSLHAYLRAFLESGMPLVELVRRLNQVIYRASTDDKFITAFIALLTPESGTIESVNAGHNPVYCVRDGGAVQELNAGGIALGMLDMDFPYQSEVTVVGAGEAVLLYTDGIPEAADETQRLYESHAPLKEYIVRHRDKPAAAFIAGLLSDIRSFTGSAPQNDDITALYLIRAR